MRTYNFLKGFSMTCVFFVLVSLMMTSAVQAAPDKVIQLRLGSWWPKSHIMSVCMEAWIKDIETETGGRVKVTYFPAGQLATDKEALDKVGKGIADMAPVICEYYQAELPLSQVNGMPFLFRDAKHGGKVVNKMQHDFNSEFEANKMKFMWGFTPPPYKPLMSKKAIVKLEEWKGLRVKTAGSIQADALKALGGIPVVIFAGEMYSSLQRGTVDGILIPTSAATSFKMQEVVNHVTQVGGINTTPIILSMNLDLWKSLPKDIQDKMMVANAKAAERTAVMYDDAETESDNAWKKLGIKFYTLTDAELAQWKKATEPLADAWMKGCEAKGLPAKKLLEESRKLAAETK